MCSESVDQETSICDPAVAQQRRAPSPMLITPFTEEFRSKTLQSGDLSESEKTFVDKSNCDSHPLRSNSGEPLPESEDLRG